MHECDCIIEFIDLCNEWIDRLLWHLVVLGVKDRLGQGQPNNGNGHYLVLC